jgi:hypothetical protein
LQTAEKLGPTPKTRDWKDGSSTGHNWNPNSDLGKAVLRDNSTNHPLGSLNPAWLEWLMGYPEGWTDLKDSVTQSSRRSRK